MSQEENKLYIECSNCISSNTIKLSSNIKCKKCNETLIGKFYKSAILSTALVGMLSGTAGTIVDDIIHINRVSVKTEFNMMVECINRNSSDRNEVNDCVCAVESLSGLLDAEQLRFRDSSWKSRELQSRYNGCKD